MTVLRKRNIIADSAPVAKSGHAPPDAALFPGVAAQKPPWIYRNDLPPDGIHGAEGTCEAHGLRAKVIQPAAREPRRRVPQRSPCRVSCSDAPKQRTIAGLTARNSSVTLRRDRATAGIPMAIPPGRFGSASMMTSKYGSRAQGQPDTAREATASVRSGKGRLDDAPHPAGRRKARSPATPGLSNMPPPCGRQKCAPPRPRQQSDGRPSPAPRYSLFCEMTCLARVASGALGNLRTSSFRRCLAAAFLLSCRKDMPCFR